MTEPYNALSFGILLSSGSNNSNRNELNPMGKKSISLLLILCCLAIDSAARQQPAAQLKPPDNYQDWGACPFECCTYREWTVLSSTALYQDRTPKAPVAFRVNRGERVIGLTGVVVTLRLGKAVVKKATILGQGKRTARAKAGDILYLLRYEGEGYYKFWFKGKIYSDQMPDAPGIIKGTQADPDNGNQYIHMISEPECIWWVKVKNRRGQVGWTKQSDHFGNMDACG